MKRIWQWCRRAWVRLYIKIVREKATPEYIARGWAIGMFYGCLIPFGLQLVLSIPTSFIMRGSKVGATLGTLITNHVTIIFIYPAQCYIGSLAMGTHRNFGDIRVAFENVIAEQSFSALGQIGMELVTAFFLGGAIFAGIMTPLTYYTVKKMVEDHRRREGRKRAKFVKA